MNGTFHWFMGDKRVGWIAGEDLAAVAGRPGGGAGEARRQAVRLSTDVLNGSEAAAEVAQALGQEVESAVMTPDDLAALLASGALQPPQHRGELRGEHAGMGTSDVRRPDGFRGRHDADGGGFAR